MPEILKPPDWLEQKVRDIGGLNPHGQPNFRIVWGWSRLVRRGGRWAKRDDNGNVLGYEVGYREVPKYLPPDRWYVEVWLGPEHFGSLADWEREDTEIIDGQMIRRLGPFPRQGEYEMILPVETPVTCNAEGVCTCKGKMGCRQFIPLTHTVCEAILYVVRANRSIPAHERLAARHRVEERLSELSERKTDELLDEIAGPFSQFRPYPGKKTKILTV